MLNTYGRSNLAAVRRSIRLTLAVQLLLGLALAAGGCQNNSNSKSSPTPPSPAGGDYVRGVEPNPITGSDLADYDNARVRCDYIKKNTALYQAQCVVVAHQIGGTEYYAIGARPGVQTSWQQPTTLTSNASVTNCKSPNGSLSYQCDVAVKDTATAAQVQFNLTISDATHEPRTENTVLMLPYSVGITLGFVPGMPVAYKGQTQTGGAALDNAKTTIQTLGFQQYDFASNSADFLHGVTLCIRGSKIYFADGLFVYEQSNGRVQLYGGSGNPLDQENTSNRLRVYLHPWSLACTADAVYVLSRTDNRIHKLYDSGAVELLVGSKDWAYSPSPDGTVAKGAPMQNLNGLAIDGKGQVFFGEGNLLRTVLADGTLKTIAGDGTFGSKGDGGPATKANFHFISGIVISGNGTIFLTDNDSGNVRRITPDGIISTVAGTGTNRYDDPSGNNPGALSEPIGLALDKQGNIYIGEFYRGVKVLSANGQLTQLISSGADIPYRFSEALQGTWQYKPITPTDLSIFYSRPAYQGLAVGDDGTLYVNGTHGIWSKPANKQVWSVLSGPAPDAVTTNCKTTVAGSESRLIEASGLTFTADNHLLVLDWLSLDSNQMVLKESSDSTSGVMVQNIAGCAQDSWLSATNVAGYRGSQMVLGTTGGLVTAGDGSIYLANRDQGKIYRYQKNGAVSIVAGNGARASAGDGGPALQASLLNPSSLAIGPDGALYFTEYESDLVLNTKVGSRVRRIDGQGTITTVAGTGVAGDSVEGQAATAASISVSSIAVADDGRLFLADLGNNKIKVVDTNGIIRTIAGTGNAATAPSSATVDALKADLWGPLSIALTHDGNVYFTNFGSAQVKQLKPRSGGGYDLLNLFGKTSSGACSTSRTAGATSAANVNTAIQNSMSILCEGQPRAITIRDTCPASGGSTHLAFSQTFGNYTNIVEVVRPCAGS